MRAPFIGWLLVILLVLCATTSNAVAQRIRFPNGSNGSQIFPGTFPQTVPNAGAPIAATPWTPIAPNIAPTITAPPILPPSTSLPPTSATPWTPVPNSGTLGGQIVPFDPYATGPAPPVFPGPTISAPANTAPALPSAPAIRPPAFQPPAFQPPSLQTAPPSILPPRNVGPIYGQPIQQQPVFPNGFDWNGQTGRQQRLFQDTGALYTYLYGDDENELEMHEVEVFTSAVLMNFARTAYGLRITPGFAFHFLDGPAVAGKAQLPGQLYSAYINALWQPQFTPQFGADLNLRVGVYTDFRSTTSDSLRLTGRGLGVVQLTPNTALKLGVEYLDRLRVKLLPAGGILYEPDPQTRWDIYFPRPKFSKYLTTNGNTEFWWHIGAEYGGGNWTIDRLNAPGLGLNDRIDINDIRIFAGIDWNQLDRFDGIAEIGYVFEREVIVNSEPTESIDLDDTVMVRVGMKF